ncbi:MAG: hypothetical protein M0Q92_14175 [Methanoregula sp.]|jgi:hypothetical protein|nr:hypothetical protein [Methanoregula sp.]
MTGYYERIIAILEPKIGRFMAVSVIRIKCGKLRIKPEKITRENLPAIADELFEPLTVFAGIEFARVLTNKIRAIEA